MSEMFVYILRDPDTFAIKYVGKTKDPHARYLQHLYGQEDTRYHKVEWIASLRENGKKPQMDVLVACDRDTAREIEAYYINLFSEQGYNLLQSIDHIPGDWPCKQRARETRLRIKTHCKNGHEFTPENTHLHPRNGYVCRTCSREQARLRKLKKEVIA